MASLVPGSTLTFLPSAATELNIVYEVTSWQQRLLWEISEVKNETKGTRQTVSKCLHVFFPEMLLSSVAP